MKRHVSDEEKICMLNRLCSDVVCHIQLALDALSFFSLKSTCKTMYALSTSTSAERYVEMLKARACSLLHGKVHMPWVNAHMAHLRERIYDQYKAMNQHKGFRKFTDASGIDTCLPTKDWLKADFYAYDGADTLWCKTVEVTETDVLSYKEHLRGYRLQVFELNSYRGCSFKLILPLINIWIDYLMKQRIATASWTIFLEDCSYKPRKDRRTMLHCALLGRYITCYVSSLHIFDKLILYEFCHG